MDWESKFSSIVRETETNLAKVKERLGSARQSSSAALNFNSGTEFSSAINGGLWKDTTYTASTPLLSTPRLNLTSGAGHMHQSNGLPASLDSIGWFKPSQDNHLKDLQEGPPLEKSASVLLLLQEKIDGQNKTIENLSRIVKRQEEEKNFYFKQVKDLRDEITMLNSRMVERGVDLATERKIESWKRDMMAEMQLLQSQVNRYRGYDDDGGIRNSQLTALSRDIQDQRRYMQDECDSMRRELETIKSKVVKLEMEFGTVTSETRDLNRRHNIMDRNLKNLSDSHSSASRELSRSFGAMEEEKLEISQVRENMAALNEKVNNLESSLNSRDSRPRSALRGPHSTAKAEHPTRFKLKSRKKGPKAAYGNIVSPHASDLDLSSDTELELKSTVDLNTLNTVNTDFNTLNTVSLLHTGTRASEEFGTLDLDNLDLSDDDDDDSDDDDDEEDQASSAGMLTTEELG